MTFREILVETIVVRGCTLALVTIALIVLKLTGVIGWSWWWVLVPSWAPFALFIVFVTVALGLAMAVGLVSAIEKSTKRLR